MEALPEVHTWQDYQALADEKRWELIRGHLVAMTPSPSVRHQTIVLRLGAQLLEGLKGSGCQPLIAPIDVKLSAHDVVQPDLLVVCDTHKVQEGYIDGSPDLVVEVLSPSTQAHDRVTKLKLYAEHEVKEYWMIQPESETLEILQLVGERYVVHGSYTADDSPTSPSFPNLAIRLPELFG